jgi:hypothetical protein
MSIYIGTNETSAKAVYLSIGSDWGASTSLGSTVYEPLPDELTALGLQRGKTYKIKEIYVGNSLIYRNANPFLPDGTNENNPGNYTPSPSLKYDSGSPYINTGIIGGLNSTSRPKIKVEMVVEFNKTVSSTVDISLLGAKTADIRFYMIHYYKNKFCIGYGNFINTATKTINYGDSLGNRFLIVSEFTPTSQTLEVRNYANNTVIGGTTINNATNTTYNTSLSMYLFAANDRGTANYINKYINIVDCKIYVYDKEKGLYKLEKSFTPCYNEAGVHGMYDLVGRQFYTPPAGSFIGQI